MHRTPWLRCYLSVLLFACLLVSGLLMVVLVLSVAANVELELGLKSPSLAAQFFVLLRPVNLDHGQFWVLIKFQFQVYRFNFSVFLGFSLQFL